MTSSDQPDPGQVAAVETSLYNRMLRNAFVGFFKSAIIAAAIGLVLGGIAAAASVNMVPNTIPFLNEGVTGVLKIAGWFAGVAGSFGAVAGIQSTRDTRRFFMMHEGQHSSPEHTTERALVMQPDGMDTSRATFQTKLAQEKSPDSLQRG